MTLKRDSSYPLAVELQDLELVLHYMSSKDVEALLRFAGDLSEHDLLFLRRDVRRLEVIEDWLMEIDAGTVVSILAKHGDEVVGETTIDRNGLQWTSHVAELRVVLARAVRGKGLGRLLAEEALRLAQRSSIEKMIARMTVDQSAAIRVFESLGFKREALMKDHVKDLEGRTHDLVVMSLKV